MRHLASLRLRPTLRLGLALTALGLSPACSEEDESVPPSCEAGSTDPACQGGGSDAPTPDSGTTGGTTGTSSPTTGAMGDGGVSQPAPAKDLPCDVLDVLQTHCHDCHGVTQSFGAPMPLVQASDFQGDSVTTAGVSMTQRVLERLEDTQRPMPPPQYERLSDEEMATFTSWLEAGAPPAAGDVGCGVDLPAPTTDGGASGDGGSGGHPNDEITFEGAPEDCTDYHVLTAHGGDTEDDPSGYEVPQEPLDSGNQYMCFYYSLPYEPGSQGLWFDPIIDDSRVLHHWLLYGTDNATHPGGAKSPCSAAEPGAYLLAGWAPGADSFRYPSDVGLKMPTGPNAGLILEVHYYNTEKLVAKDRSGVKFCTAPADTREHTAGVHFLGSEAICVQPGQQQEVNGVCDPRDDMGDIHILNVWPHMHQLGRHMRATIQRSNGAQEVLHDEPFDFNNQINYPKDDVIIRPGDQITATCTFQNTRDVRAPFGDKTQDEMCYLFVTAWPVDSLSNDPNGLYSTLNPVNGIAAFLQPLQRCMDPTSIFGSCNGLADYPTSF